MLENIFETRIGRPPEVARVQVSIPLIVRESIDARTVPNKEVSHVALMQTLQIANLD